jgi:hypothetical protein
MGGSSGYTHITLKAGKAGGAPAAKKLRYIRREGEYAARQQELVATVTRNLPSWANDDASRFWRAADRHEGENRRRYVELEIALHRSLGYEQNLRLLDDFLEQTLGDRHTYTVGIHRVRASDGEENLHAHVMLCERALDGIDRQSPQHFFKRADPKIPERGGAKKDPFWGHKHAPLKLRKCWTSLSNSHFYLAGSDLQLSPERLNRPVQPYIPLAEFQELKKGRVTERMSTVLRFRNARQLEEDGHAVEALAEWSELVGTVKGAELAVASLERQIEGSVEESLKNAATGLLGAISAIRSVPERFESVAELETASRDGEPDERQRRDDEERQRLEEAEIVAGIAAEDERRLREAERRAERERLRAEVSRMDAKLLASARATDSALWAAARDLALGELLKELSAAEETRIRVLAASATTAKSTLDASLEREQERGWVSRKWRLWTGKTERETAPLVAAESAASRKLREAEQGKAKAIDGRLHTKESAAEIERRRRSHFESLLTERSRTRAELGRVWEYVLTEDQAQKREAERLQLEQKHAQEMKPGPVLARSRGRSGPSL